MNKRYISNNSLEPHTFVQEIYKNNVKEYYQRLRLNKLIELVEHGEYLFELYRKLMEKEEYDTATSAYVIGGFYLYFIVPQSVEFHTRNLSYSVYLELKKKYESERNMRSVHLAVIEFVDQVIQETETYTTGLNERKRAYSLSGNNGSDVVKPMDYLNLNVSGKSGVIDDTMWSAPHLKACDQLKLAVSPTHTDSTRSFGFQSDASDSASIHEWAEDVQCFSKIHNSLLPSSSTSPIQSAVKSAASSSKCDLEMSAKPELERDVLGSCVSDILNSDGTKRMSRLHESSSIRCKDLMHLLRTDMRYSILVVDLRLKRRFEKNHIVANNLINIDPNMLWDSERGSHLNSIEMLEKRVDDEMFTNRGRFNYIVCYTDNYTYMHSEFHYEFNFFQLVYSGKPQLVTKCLLGGYDQWKAFLKDYQKKEPINIDDYLWRPYGAGKRPKSTTSYLSNTSPPEKLFGMQPPPSTPVVNMQSTIRAPPYLPPEVFAEVPSMVQLQLSQRNQKTLIQPHNKFGGVQIQTLTERKNPSVQQSKNSVCSSTVDVQKVPPIPGHPPPPQPLTILTPKTSTKNIMKTLVMGNSLQNEQISQEKFPVLSVTPESQSIKHFSAQGQTQVELNQLLPLLASSQPLTHSKYPSIHKHQNQPQSILQASTHPSVALRNPSEHINSNLDFQNDQKNIEQSSKPVPHQIILPQTSANHSSFDQRLELPSSKKLMPSAIPRNESTRRNSSYDNIWRISDQTINSKPAFNEYFSNIQDKVKVEKHNTDLNNLTLQTYFSVPAIENSSNEFVALSITGLRNMSNTCYINSMLQCLFSTIPFRNLILSNAYSKYFKSTEMEVMSKSFYMFFRKMYMNGGCSVVPTGFLKTCSNLKPDLKIPNGQQDTQEFLLFLLDRLHQELSDTAAVGADYAYLLLHDNDRLNVNGKEYDRWFEENLEKNGLSPIDDIFQGQTENHLSCKNCGYSSYSYSTFYVLSLALPSPTAKVFSKSKKLRLEDCINFFTCDEVLTGQNAWDCPKCGLRVNFKSKEQDTQKKKVVFTDLDDHIDEEPPRSRSRLFKFKSKSKTPGRPPTSSLKVSSNTPDRLKTNKKSATIKTLNFITLPRILIIHLSRFVYDLTKKNNTVITYPLILDIVLKNNDIARFRLYSIVNHFGTLVSGHYTALVNKETNHEIRFGKQKWYYFDDEIVKHDPNHGNFDEGITSVSSGNVYVLFYERISNELFTCSKKNK